MFQPRFAGFTNPAMPCPPSHGLLVEAREAAIHTFVEAPGLVGRNVELICGLQGQVAGPRGHGSATNKGGLEVSSLRNPPRKWM